MIPKIYILVAGAVEVRKDGVLLKTTAESGAVFGEISALLDIPHIQCKKQPRPQINEILTPHSAEPRMTLNLNSFMHEPMETGRGKFISPDLRTVLFAEDDEGYALLLRCAFKTAGFGHTLHHVQDGAEAIAYLKGEGKYADRSKFGIPCVILVDLKMPKINGYELLEWIRHHSDVPHVPVVVLTSSDEIRDIQKAYSIGANSFLVKPPNIEDLKAIVRMIDSYWMKLNRSEAEPPFSMPDRTWKPTPSELGEN